MLGMMNSDVNRAREAQVRYAKVLRSPRMKMLASELVEQKASPSCRNIHVSQLFLVQLESVGYMTKLAFATSIMMV